MPLHRFCIFSAVCWRAPQTHLAPWPVPLLPPNFDPILVSFDSLWFLFWKRTPSLLNHGIRLSHWPFRSSVSISSEVSNLLLKLNQSSLLSHSLHVNHSIFLVFILPFSEPFRFWYLYFEMCAQFSRCEQSRAIATLSVPFSLPFPVIPCIGFVCLIITEWWYCNRR